VAVVRAVRQPRPVHAHQRYARFHQSASEKTGLAEPRATIAVANARRFGVEVEGFASRRCRNHLERAPDVRIRRNSRPVARKAGLHGRSSGRAVERVEQPLAAVETHRRHVRRQRQTGHVECGLFRFTGDQPRIGGPAQEPRVLTGPRQVAVVGTLFRQRDRGRQLAPRLQELPHHAAHARPVVRRTRLRVLDLHRGVRHAGRHVVTRSRVGVIVGRNRSENRDFLRQAARPHHRLADDETGRCGPNHAQVAACFRGRVRLRIPRFLLRRRAEQEQQNDAFRLFRDTFRGPGAK